MNDDVFFDFIDSNGQIKKGEVLCLFELKNYNKEYALCSIPTNDGDFDITAFIVNKVNNEVSFEDIVDSDELNDVVCTIEELFAKNKCSTDSYTDEKIQSSSESLNFYNTVLENQTAYFRALNSVLQKLKNIAFCPSIDLLLDSSEPKNSKSRKKYINALNCYCRKVENGLPILLCDETIIGNGKKGFVLNTNCIYCSQYKYLAFDINDIINIVANNGCINLVKADGNSYLITLYPEDKSELFASTLMEIINFLKQYSFSKIGENNEIEESKSQNNVESKSKSGNATQEFCNKHNSTDRSTNILNDAVTLKKSVDCELTDEKLSEELRKIFGL